MQVYSVNRHRYPGATAFRDPPHRAILVNRVGGAGRGPGLTEEKLIADLQNYFETRGEKKIVVGKVVVGGIGNDVCILIRENDTKDRYNGAYRLSVRGDRLILWLADRENRTFSGTLVGLLNDYFGLEAQESLPTNYFWEIGKEEVNQLVDGRAAGMRVQSTNPAALKEDDTPSEKFLAAIQYLFPEADVSIRSSVLDDNICVSVSLVGVELELSYDFSLGQFQLFVSRRGRALETIPIDKLKEVIYMKDVFGDPSDRIENHFFSWKIGFDWAMKKLAQAKPFSLFSTGRVVDCEQSQIDKLLTAAAHAFPGRRMSPLTGLNEGFVGVGVEAREDYFELQYDASSVQFELYMPTTAQAVRHAAEYDSLRFFFGDANELSTNSAVWNVSFEAAITTLNQNVIMSEPAVQTPELTTTQIPSRPVTQADPARPEKRIAPGYKPEQTEAIRRMWAQKRAKKP